MTSPPIAAIQSTTLTTQAEYWAWKIRLGATISPFSNRAQVHGQGVELTSALGLPLVGPRDPCLVVLVVADIRNLTGWFLTGPGLFGTWM